METVKSVTREQRMGNRALGGAGASPGSWTEQRRGGAGGAPCHSHKVQTGGVLTFNWWGVVGGGCGC